MRFGFYVNPQTPGPDHDGPIIESTLQQVELAERLGFDDVWLTEHHFLDYNAYTDPLMLATAIARRTSRIQIGFSLAVVPFHHPIRFVTQCNLLDHLSHGRLIVGVGPGNCPEEFVGFGHVASERHAMMAEFMTAIETAWNAPESGFAYSGKHYNGAVRGRIIPAPFQRPRPHIAWATLTEATMVQAAHEGYSWLIGPQSEFWLAPRLKRYFAALNEAGLAEEVIRRARAATGMNRHVYVAAPGEDWHATIDEYIEVYVRKSARSNSGIDNLPKDDYERRRDGFVRNWLYAGTADEIVEWMRPFAELGLGHLMCWLSFGHMPDYLVRQSIQRLASDVIPRVKAIKPDPEALDRVIAATPADAAFWTPSIKQEIRVADVSGQAYRDTIEKFG